MLFLNIILTLCFVGLKMYVTKLLLMILVRIQYISIGMIDTYTFIQYPYWVRLSIPAVLRGVSILENMLLFRETLTALGSESAQIAKCEVPQLPSKWFTGIVPYCVMKYVLCGMV